MSEKQQACTHRSIRRKLMTTASALALCASAYSAGRRRRTPTGHTLDRAGRTIERIARAGRILCAALRSELVADGFESPIKAQRILRKSLAKRRDFVSARGLRLDFFRRCSLRPLWRRQTEASENEGCPCSSASRHSSGNLHPVYIPPPGARCSESRVRIAKAIWCWISRPEGGWRGCSAEKVTRY